MEQNTIFHKSLRRHERRQIITILSAVIAIAAFFAVQASLSRYSEALSSEPRCGMEEHVHTDACYDNEGNLICTLMEHTHTEECYQEEVQVEEPVSSEEDAVSEDEETKDSSDKSGEQVLPEEDAAKEPEESEDKGNDSDEPEENVLDLQDQSSGCTTVGSEPVSNARPVRKMMKAAPLRSGENNIFDFGNYITSSVVEKQINGTWTPSVDFNDQDSVRVVLNFAIPDGSLTASNPVMQYQIPHGIILDHQETGDVMEGDKVIGTYSISNTGVITITYDPNKLNVTKSFTGTVFFTGTVSCDETGTQTAITLPGGTTINIIPTEATHDISAGKTRTSYDPNTNTAIYKVTVSTTKGTGEAVSIEDWIGSDSTGTGTYDINSVSIKKIASDSSETTISATPSIDGDGKLIMNLPALSAGEKYELIYSINNIAANGADGSGRLKNNVKATSGTLQYVASSEFEFQKSSIYKSGYYDSAVNLIRWSIKINDNGSNIAGKTVTDVLPEGVELVGSIVVKKNYNDYSGPAAAFENNTITFTVPENAAGDTSVYTLDFCTTAPDNASPVDNTATFDNHHSTATAYPQGQELNISKTWQSKDELGSDLIQYNWNSSVTIPKTGIPVSGLTLTDTILSPVSGNELIEGAHYALYGDLNAAIEEQLYVIGINPETLYAQEYRVSEANDLEYSVVYFGMDGSPLTGEIDSNTRVSGFSITVLPKNGAALTNYHKLTLKTYPTVIDTSSFVTGSLWTIQNKAVSGDKETTASHDYSGQEGLKKLLMIDENTGESGDHTFNYEDVEQKDFKLHYKVLINRALISDSALENEYAVDVTDTLPAGTEYVEDSMTLYFGRLNGSRASDIIHDNNYTYTIQENSSVNYDNENNQLNVKLRSHDSTYADASIKAQMSDELRYVILDYYIRITDPSFLNGASSVSVYENGVQWGNQSTSQKTTIKSHSGKLWKTGTDVSKETDMLRRIHYQIVVNKDAQNLNETGDTILLTDYLTTHAQPSLNVNSLKVYHYSETAENHLGSALHSDYWSAEYEETNSKMLNITVPDEMPLVIVYDYMFDVSNAVADIGNDKVKVENSAVITGVVTHSTSNGIRASSSGVTTEQQNIIIQKVDSNNVTERLTGAVFKLEYWDSQDNAWKLEDQTRKAIYLEKREGGNIQYDENGEVIWDYVWGSTNSSAAENHRLQQNRLYRLTETVAPNGYVINTTAYHFILKTAGESDDDAKSQSGADSANVYSIHYFGSGGGNIIIKNTKDTDGIGVKKVWKNRSGEIVDAPNNRTVEVTIYQMLETKETATITVAISNQNPTHITVPVGSHPTLKIYGDSYHYGDHPIVTVDDKELTMSLQSSDGSYMAEYGPLDAVNNDITINIIEPVWVQLKENYTDDDYSYSINYDSSQQYGETITLPYNGKWTYYWDGLPKTDPNGNRYFYLIEEKGITGDDLNNYITTYDSGGVLLAPGSNEVITNQAKDTYILPQTGGTGTLLYRMAGVLILLTGGILLLRKGVRDP